MNTTLLTCPICKMGLNLCQTPKSCTCPSNHSYDIARQGYINLLPSNQKNTANPGDSKEMVLARQAFLDRDFYKPLSTQLNTLMLTHLTTLKQPLYILDIGCGEGYYLSQLINQAEQATLPCSFYGLDISKEAVKTAAAKCKEATWIVGNSHNMPFIDNGFDGAFSVFSPIIPEECRRILKPGGILARVLPGMHHLIEMRELIYPEVVLNEETDPWQNTPHFKTNTPIKVTYSITLTQQELLALVQMTPHYWKTSKENKAVLNTITQLNVTIDMRILVYIAM